MGKLQKKQIKQGKRYLLWGAAALAVLLLAVMPMLASGREPAEGRQASILSAAAEYRDIATQIIGGGQLSSEAAIRLKIPEEVKLTKYLVGNGDKVSEGDAIAAVDKVSVMTAITGVQETLEHLSEEIAGVSDEEASSYVKALAGGTVKVIYAKEGESVQNVMLDHGALAVLSLDDTMAVQIERATDLDAGDTVTVTLAGGTEVDGRVKSNVDGLLTVTIEDDDYAVGTQVTVETEAGDRIGTGELYIFSPWNATAYSGTVSDILVVEGDTVAVGRSLMQLEDPGHTAEYQRLIDQRHEYEELMQELFQMYRTETITAPCDGIVTGVDEDGAYLLAEDGEEGWFVRLLSFLEAEEDSGFQAYGVKVTAVSEDGMDLLIDPACIRIEEFAGLSGVSADLSAMTEPWHYSGDTTICTQSAEGLLHRAGKAKPGDILLAVGDAEGVRWFVVLNGSGEEAQAAQTSSYPGGSFAFLLSATEGDTDAYTGTDGTGGEEDNSNETVGEADTGNEESGDDGTGSDEGDDAPAAVSILTTALNQGVAGQSYSSPLQATDGTNLLSGLWAASGLPNGLAIDPSTGVISGTPAEAGSYTVTVSFTYQDTPVTRVFTLNIAAAEAVEKTYTGYAAQVTEIVDGAMKVKQAAQSYPITDLNELPAVSADTAAMTEEKTYICALIRGDSAQVGDILLIVVDAEGTLVKLAALTAAPGTGEMPGTGEGGMPSAGGMPSGGGAMTGGMGQVQTFELYSLEKLTVASVTSQEHMTVEVTIDELDITRIYVGQEATITVDALAGESFSAAVSQIANSGENEGGNSKFTVELTLEKSGGMLPGMTASAYITLATTENALCVPVSALNEVNGETVLYTSYDEDTAAFGDPAAVTIGAADAEYVQILDGIEAGRTFYYAYYDTPAEEDGAPGAMSLGRGRT